MQYSFILKNEKSKNYKAVGQLLIFFNLLGFAFLLISDKDSPGKNIWLLSSVVITAVYSLFAFVKWFTKKTLPDLWHRAVFAFCSLAWVYEGYWWLSVLMAIFILFDILAQRKLIVIITEKKIIIPSVPKKEVEWAELSNLILKDGLLTIDFKNNKLFQQMIENSNEEVDEKKFNDFCKSNLTFDF
jgi:hypothetical protein